MAFDYQFHIYLLCLGANLALCPNSVLNVRALVDAFNQEKALIFVNVCLKLYFQDNTDERPCPIVYLFDDCVEMTGDPSCGWQEEPRDSLDWKLVNSSESGVSWDGTTDLHCIVTFSIFQDVGGRNGVYLWIQKDSDDFAESTARIVSPIYRNSGSNCKLRFQYYISGNMNNDYVKPSIHPVGSEMPIVMDYLTVNEEWKPHEIGIGRKRGQFQVCEYVQYYNLFLY